MRRSLTLRCHDEKSRVCWLARVPNPDDQQRRLVGPNGILSPISQFGTADLSVGGSAGVPSGCSSLKVNAIGPLLSRLGPDGSTSITSRRRDAKGFADDRALMSMGGLDSDLEDLYRRRHGAFQVMLASVTGSVESARDVVQEAFAQALRDQNGFRGEGSLEGVGVADRVPGRGRVEGVARARRGRGAGGGVRR